jgi:hypothetical protein
MTTPPNISIFSREFSIKNSMTVLPINLTFLFPRMKIKLKGSYFGTIEVMKAESQAVFNTLTEHVFQDALRI